MTWNQLYFQNNWKIHRRCYPTWVRILLLSHQRIVLAHRSSPKGPLWIQKSHNTFWTIFFSAFGYLHDRRLKSLIKTYQLLSSKLKFSRTSWHDPWYNFSYENQWNLIMTPVICYIMIEPSQCILSKLYLTRFCWYGRHV